jgi:hypothetical protein
MAIMMPPAPLPLRNVKWRAPFPAQVNRSGWTGTRKVVGQPGATIWTASGQFVTIMRAVNANPWKGWFTSLQGPVHSFPLIAVEARQTNVANPVVGSGASDAGFLPLSGLPASTTVLGTGMMMTVPLPNGHKRLVCLTAPLVSNAGGLATAFFGPELGQIPAAGATVEIREPFGLMSLTSDPPGWDVSEGQTYSFQIDAEEAL